MGGIQLLMDRVVRYLEAFQIRLVTRGADGPITDLRDDVCLIRTRLRQGPLSIVALNARIVIEGLRHRSDVILCGHIFLSPATALLRWLTGARVVTYLYADEVP